MPDLSHPLISKKRNGQQIRVGDIKRAGAVHRESEPARWFSCCSYFPGLLSLTDAIGNEIHPSRWGAVVSMAKKIGCVPRTLHEWVRKAEIDSGKRAGVPTDVTKEVKALRRENCTRPTDFLRKTSAYFPRWSSTAHSSENRLHR